MLTFVQTALLVLFLVPFVLDRRTRRRLDPALMPAADRPPAAAGDRAPRPWARRRYVEDGVAEVAAYLSEQDPAR
ncbi:hypothetical protein MN205_18030 [Kineococcus sp. TRM81007]|uniref:hypothetical protein n=1 Tax=Kineococcus sp. TRM81007 TaxID=2925831 RepID=UPI001F593D6E|nr:hypothetical protein [Kineococcus sp. TRM81007]MCI2240367.1 hypothetical protein [Kineococcus sp. TRM81007]